YALTEAGREAIAAWRAAPATDLGELRSPGLLQLFFGAEKEPLARAQVEAHAAKLDEYEQLHAQAGEWLPEGQRLALEAGIAHEREWLRFWRAMLP
ncbi:MAG: PadR family transcriptional regulator, partial [Actinomycetota bacterium]|nr:PadR family transcriptional regulator [Actinomycetota bacterium]